MPEARPRAEAFLWVISSTSIQEKPAAAVATKVLIMASEA